MNTSNYFRIIIAFLILNGAFIQSATSANDIDSLLQIRKNREVKISGIVEITDILTPAAEVDQYMYIPDSHPAVYLNDSIYSDLHEQVKMRAQIFAKDSLSGSELFWALRPFLLWARSIDPHLRAEPNPLFTDKKGADMIPVPGFTMFNIGETLIVERSVDPQFKRGDKILAINGIPAAEYLQYCYDDRHIYPFTLLSNYHYEIVSARGFTISIERDGRRSDISTDGMPWIDVYVALHKQQEFRSCIFTAAKAGYFTIGEFYPDNALLINKLRKSILRAQKQGCNSFIIDLRGNPGGYGADFDRLLSLFIDKPSIPYMKKQFVQVSEHTMRDYDFLTEDSIGRKVELPDRYMVKDIELDRKIYIPGMRYYVLMDRDTGSVSASFCNIMQYNGAAELVGEPLLRNALKYGETMDSWLYLSPLLLSSSTVEFDEYTRAVEGVLMPDIDIPYRAEEYLTGQDAMLDKLLEIIEYRLVN